MLTAFITGISGFVGQHLARQLQSQGYTVIGGVRSLDEAFPLLSPQELTGVRCRTYQLGDPASMEAIFETTAPQVIFHLAAQSFVPAAIADPVGTFQVNALGTLNLLSAVRAVRDRIPGFDPVIVQAASAEVYGKAQPDQMPLSETTPHRPANPYAASKVAQLAIGLSAHATWGLKVITATPFNHIGPGQSSQFVVSSFAQQLARIAKGEMAPVLRVGNLAARRDFTDVRDVVRAYSLMALHGRPGEVYNICSGRSVSIQSILDALVSTSGLSVDVQPDPARMRPSDVPDLYGSAAKLQAATGWAPKIPLEQTLQDAYTHWQQTLVPAKAPAPGQVLEKR